ncbi:type 1 glutamine amidotransferase domain-containing protein [Oceanospirillum sanctuarii]|uniref:type 1 glutamine amidotransferase domain-containing protein n=1 Tax=Oceanospirillum sanctuarii TaxID=1434821 RepID=UPI000A3754A1|nr:type 1 glutamine amidotransferase domain-containing protein [Oceanospirillum sanctuarii]
MLSAPKKILIVLTNHSEYPNRNDATGLWLTELTHFLEKAEQAGFETTFTSPLGGNVPLDERSLGWLYMDRSARSYLNDEIFQARLNNTPAADEVDPTEFDAIYFTGGHGVMWDFRDNPPLKNVAETIYRNGGVVSAVCHGVAGLINLEDATGNPLIQNRNLTGFSNREELLSGLKDDVPFLLEDELNKKGARYQSSWIPFIPHAITDGRLVTGQNPSSAKAVADRVIALLKAENL